MRYADGLQILDVGQQGGWLDVSKMLAFSSSEASPPALPRADAEMASRTAGYMPVRKPE